MLVVKKLNLCLVVTLVCILMLLLRVLYVSLAVQKSSRTSLTSHPSCYTDDSPRLLIVVTSHEEDNRARYVFREGPMQQTWLSCSGDMLDVSWKFSLQYIATLYDGYIPYSLALESDTNNDMIENAESRYTGTITSSKLASLEHILQQYDWDFLIMITDRTVVDPSKLIDYLPSSTTDQAPYYGGLVSHAGPAALVYMREELTILSRLALQNILAAGRFVGASESNEAVRVGRIAQLLRMKPHLIGQGYNATHFSAGPGVCRDAVYLTNAGLDTLRTAYTTRASRPAFC